MTSDVVTNINVATDIDGRPIEYKDVNYFILCCILFIQGAAKVLAHQTTDSNKAPSVMCTETEKMLHLHVSRGLLLLEMRRSFAKMETLAAGCRFAMV